MAKGLNMRSVLSLDSKQFKNELNKIKKQVGGFANFLKGAFALGSITAFGKQMIQVGADFENAMSRVQAVSNATTKEFQAMQEEAQRLGATTKYTATEAANALENLTRNGMTAVQATKALEGVLQLAQANAIELANAADILTNTMNAFGLSVSDTQRINDVLSTAAANAATNINELYEAMVVAGPYSKIMGKSMEETAAAIGVLANNGIKGSGAGKAIAAMYQRLSAITPKARKELEKYNIVIDENIIKSQSLAKTLKQLADSGIGGSVEALSEIFGKNFAGDISQLINNVDALDTMLEKVGKSAGTTARMFNQGVGSVQKEIDTLKSSYEGLLISISQKTGGVVKNAIRLLQNLINNFKTTEGTILNIASVAVPLLTGKVVKLVKEFRTFFTMIKTEGAIATATMGGWITAIATLVTWVGTALVGAYSRANQAMKDARGNIEKMNAEMVDSEAETAKLKTRVTELLDALEPEKDKKTLSGIVNELVRLFPEFEGTIRSAAEQAGKTGKWEKFRDILIEIADAAGKMKGIEVSDKLKASLGTAASLQLTNGEKQTINTSTQYGVVSQSITIPPQIIQELRKVMIDYAGGNKDLGEQYYNQALQYIGELFATYGDDFKTIGASLIGYLKNFGGGAIYPIEMAELVGNELKKALTEEGKKYIGSISQTIAQELSTLKDARDKAYSNVLFTESYFKGKKEFDEKMKLALEAFSKVDEEYRKKAGTNAAYAKRMNFPTTFENADALFKKYDYLLQTKTGSDIVGDVAKETATTETEQIKELLKEYKKKEQSIKSQIAAETAEQKELDDLQESTWKAITAFENFRKILDELGEGKELENAVSQNKYREQKAEQRKDLSNYTLPEKQQRDTLFDFTKTKDEIATEELKIKLDYRDELEKLVKDLQTGIDNGDFELVKYDAVERLKQLKEALEEIRKSAVTAQQSLDISEQIKDIDKQIQDLNDSVFSTISSIAEASDRIIRSLKSIAEIFDEDITDSEFFKGFEKFFSLLNSTIQLFEGVKSVIDLFSSLSSISDLTAQKKMLADKSAELGVTEAISVAETQGTVAAGGRLAVEEALAQAAASRAAAEAAANAMLVPYPANIAALTSNIGAITTAFATIKGLAAFAEGGIIGGTSTTGDKQLARVNAGEMILNKAQQGNLFNAISNGGLGGGNVEFIIRGDKLVGAINNYNAKRKGI